MENRTVLWCFELYLKDANANVVIWLQVKPTAVQTVSVTHAQIAPVWSINKMAISWGIFWF